MPNDEKSKVTLSKCDPSPDDLDDPEGAELALLNQAAKERADKLEQAAQKPVPSENAA